MSEPADSKEPMPVPVPLDPPMDTRHDAPEIIDESGPIHGQDMSHRDPEPAEPETSPNDGEEEKSDSK